MIPLKRTQDQNCGYLPTSVFLWTPGMISPGSSLAYHGPLSCAMFFLEDVRPKLKIDFQLFDCTAARRVTVVVGVMLPLRIHTFRPQRQLFFRHFAIFCLGPNTALPTLCTAKRRKN